jgi:hypothetical protein
MLVQLDFVGVHERVTYVEVQTIFAVEATVGDIYT